jgi:DNA-binding LacI/PurR family transcriptional regulator
MVERMAARVSSIEVARLAGVSQSTVSRVFSADGPNVSEKTRQRVLNAAEALGYHPNAIARMMSRGRSDIIGIVIANIANLFYPFVLDKFLTELQRIGRHVLLFTVPPDQEIDDILPLVLQYQVDALIITSATLSSAMAQECSRRGTPVILFNRHVEAEGVSTISTDNLNGGRLVADLLLDTRHERIAYVAGTPQTSTNSDRERGFTARLGERGRAIAVRLQGDFTYDSAFAAVHDLLYNTAPNARPDALFCANDSMALGAIDAAKSLGIRIPDDLSVIGFDDIPMAGWNAYNLTTIAQDVDAMIALTLKTMLTHITEPDTPRSLHVIPGRLRVRGSVRGLPAREE